MDTVGSTHLLVLNPECGQSGLQLVVPHEQFCLHGLLGTDLAHLQRHSHHLCLPGPPYLCGAQLGLTPIAQAEPPALSTWLMHIAHAAAWEPQCP